MEILSHFSVNIEISVFSFLCIIYGKEMMCQYSNVPRECWYIMCFTLNYPWAVYPGCRLTLWDNRAGSLHSWLVLACVSAGAVEAFHQLSSNTDPTPITFVNVTWLHADLLWMCLLFLLPSVQCQFSSEWLGSNLASSLPFRADTTGTMVVLAKSCTLRFWENLSIWTQYSDDIQSKFGVVLCLS